MEDLPYWAFGMLAGMLWLILKEGLPSFRFREKFSVRRSRVETKTLKVLVEDLGGAWQATSYDEMGVVAVGRSKKSEEAALEKMRESSKLMLSQASLEFTVERLSYGQDEVVEGEAD